MVLLISLIGSALLNVWGLRNGDFDYVCQHRISTACIQIVAAYVNISNMQAHRRSRNNVGAYQLESLCLYASFLKWCKVATCILSINVALSSTYDVFTLLSISWNVIAILLCFTQPYLMALVLVTTICYFGHFIAYSLICYVGSRKYLSFHNMFRWVCEIRSQDSILSTLLPSPTDIRMWRSIIAAHIVNTKTECTANKFYPTCYV